jgi:hypothetical protein
MAHLPCSGLSDVGGGGSGTRSGFGTVDAKRRQEASAEGVCTADRGSDTNFSKMEGLRVLSNRCNVLINHQPSIIAKKFLRRAHVK